MHGLFNLCKVFIKGHLTKSVPTISSLKSNLYMQNLLEQDQLFREAQDLLKAGELEKALPLIDRAIKLDPTKAVPHALKGHYYRKQSDFESAIKCYSEAQESNPYWGVPYTCIAQCLIRISVLHLIYLVIVYCPVGQLSSCQFLGQGTDLFSRTKTPIVSITEIFLLDL